MTTAYIDSPSGLEAAVEAARRFSKSTEGDVHVVYAKDKDGLFRYWVMTAPELQMQFPMHKDKVCVSFDRKGRRFMYQYQPPNAPDPPKQEQPDDGLVPLRLSPDEVALVEEILDLKEQDDNLSSTEESLQEKLRENRSA